ncbi:MAG: serine/threonine-protein kinase [Candidatus Palauibacterales bacterium]|nr:serine/threonine-protein kinase [Candidatus Palauibacterales bacterium]
MPESATLVHVTGTSPDLSISSGLPPDLLEQVRKRVRVLALLLLAAFGSDLVIALGIALSSLFRAGSLPPVAAGEGSLLFANVLAVAASLTLWWAAGKSRVSPSRLLTLGLGYEVLICFVIAVAFQWGHYRESGVVPSLTWVPVVVILFPTLLPGPPRKMLAGSIAAAATVPLSLAFLDATGRVVADGDAYSSAVMASAFAVLFAYVSARVVYGLGREVVAARRAGGYQLEELVGKGGMGEVWRATHRMLARPAAIKLIRHDMTAGEDRRIATDAVQRFEREARTIAGLRSPHTVELFDFGRADNGAFYFAMELLDGLDADTLVRQFGPVPAERAVHLLSQVCHSLSEAHSRGLVHRDIKPANVFVCRYGEEVDFVKVLDFGIVKELQGEPGEPGLTNIDAIQGTPAFLAPEQALGTEGLDGRCDIYATGCLAYWLLTGEHVFTADTPVKLLLQHVQSAPVAPSSRTELTVPAALDEIVLACLAKDPADRPQTARELARRLDAVGLEAEWTEERARQWWDLHQAVPEA